VAEGHHPNTQAYSLSIQVVAIKKALVFCLFGPSDLLFGYVYINSTYGVHIGLYLHSIGSRLAISGQ